MSNRIEKVLEEANLKLAAVVTRIQGVTAQAILHAIVEGETDPQPLADLAQGSLRRKREDLVRALDGEMRLHHRFLLGRLLRHLEFLDAEIAAVEQETTQLLEALPAYRAAIERLDAIPSVSWEQTLRILDPPAGFSYQWNRKSG